MTRPVVTACGEADAPPAEGETPLLDAASDTLVGEIPTYGGRPLEPEDRGATVTATGWVTGAPILDGFFLLTPEDREIFVADEQPLERGDPVRVVGIVAETDSATFRAWRVQAYEEMDAPDTRLETGFFIEASDVAYADALPTEERPAPLPGPGAGDTPPDLLPDSAGGG